jgi:hypothetical protein
MLTDPAGDCVEVSTTSYRPTRTIWNDVIARYATCFRAGCDRPAADCELDHKVPWPQGVTSNRNLWPGCGRDHTAKHTPGYRITTDPDTGDAAFHTRAGFTHPTGRATQPTGANAVPDDLFGFPYTATEIRDALTYLAGLHHLDRTGPLAPDELCDDAA